MISSVSDAHIPLNRLIAAAAGSPARAADVRASGPSEVSRAAPDSAIGKSELTEQEKQQIEELQRRDRAVRQHEQAHKAAAGRYAKGGPSFEYEVGPDGRRYAVGGEVQIDTSEVPDDPEATIRKMQVIKRAASAPSEPSAQDRQVAAAAAQKEQQARVEQTRQQTEDARQQPAVEPQTGPVEPQQQQVDAAPQPDQVPKQPFLDSLVKSIESQSASGAGGFIDVVV